MVSACKWSQSCKWKLNIILMLAKYFLLSFWVFLVFQFMMTQMSKPKHRKRRKEKRSLRHYWIAFFYGPLLSFFMVTSTLLPTLLLKCSLAKTYLLKCKRIVKCLGSLVLSFEPPFSCVQSKKQRTGSLKWERALMIASALLILKSLIIAHVDDW